MSFYQKPKALALVCPAVLALAALLWQPAWAGSITVTLDGVTQSYSFDTLNQLNIAADGSIAINASSQAGAGTPTYTLTANAGAGGTISGGGSGSYVAGTQLTFTAIAHSGFAFSAWTGCTTVHGATCLVTMDSNKIVTASFSANASTCSSGSSLVCVNTALPEQYFVQTTYRPSPATVYAFKFDTVRSGSYSGSATAARTTGTPASKLIVISSVPGDTEVNGKPPACYGQSVEVSTVRYVVNYPNARPSTYCHLEPGKTYYFNVSSQTASSTTPTCTSAADCGYSFSAR